MVDEKDYEGPHLAPNPTRATETTSPGLDSNTAITNEWLTFKTPVPTPNTKAPSPPTHHDSPIPPPDLAQYANPLTWPSSRKYIMLALSCIATFLTAYTSGSYSPPHQLMREDLGASSNIAVLAGITTFCVGFALAPMILAPFSEMNGRYPVFVVAGILYVVAQAICGVVRTLAGMLVARLFVGIGASVFSTMVGGVIADMWDKEDRNTPMALFSGAVMLGTGAGPLVAAVMTERWGHIGSGNAAAWKWTFWHQVIMGTICIVSLAFLFKESRGSVLLSRKAKALNKWYEQLEEQGYYGVWLDDDECSDSSESLTAGSGSDEEKGGSRSLSSTATLKRIRWLVKEDEERSSLAKMITISVSRPFHLLFTESIVFFFSLWVSFAWGVLYLTFGCIPMIFRRQYGWDIERAGYIFSSIMVGGIIGTAISIWQEKVLHHPSWAAPAPSSSSSSLTLDGDASDRSSPDDIASKASTTNPSISDRFWAFMRHRFPSDSPEARLYFTCVISTLLPIGLFILGFTARPHIHWIFPSIGIALATVGILSIYLAVFNYFADSYHQFASSALAAQSMCRNLVGGAFPLVTAMMIENLGESRMTITLGSIAIGLTVVPWVLVFYGDRIRARSPFASNLGKG
ncbi:hypothetical protein OQA88_3015 [Cercophora sp. LCS_1]